MTGLPCPNCGSELAFLEQYQRHYCYACGAYAPEGFGDRGAKRCPTCTGILSYVTQYNRFYCYRCSAYPPEGALVTPSPTTSESSQVLATASPTALVVMEPQKQAESASFQEERSEEATSSGGKRPLDRDEIVTAKKPLLAQLCKDHDLDATGTREELRQRLLVYLDEIEKTATPATEVEPVQEQWEQLPQISEASPNLEPTFETTVPEERIEPVRERIAVERPQEAPKTSAVVTPPATASYPAQTLVTPVVPVPVTMTPSREAAVEIPTIPTTRAEHPCPTCGRELAYISQYDRWYCYSCRAYAPRKKAKFACPNCGAALRWITQYERWWCDACRRYAPADLPKPERSATATSTVQPAATRTAEGTVAVHRHQSPGGGIGLLTFGLLLFVVYEILVDLPLVLRVNTGLDVAPDVAFGLRFFAFLFVAAGALLGLSAVRDRR